MIAMLSCLLWNSAIAALMAVCLIFAGRCLRLTPATRHALWLVVLVKLLSPIGLIWSVPLPFDPPVEMAMTPSTENEAETVSTTEAVYVISLTEHEGEALTIESPLQSETANALRSPNRHSSTALRWVQSLSVWLLMLWFAGSLVVAWRYLVQTVRFAHFARRGKIAGNWLKRPIEELAQKLGVRTAGSSHRFRSGLAGGVVSISARALVAEGIAESFERGRARSGSRA